MAARVNGFTKISLADYDESTEIYRKSPPATVHLAAPSGQSTVNALLTSNLLDGGEYRISLCETRPFLDVLGAALRSDTKTLTIFLNRKARSLDIATPILLDIMDSDAKGNRTRGTREMLSFTTCVERGF